VSACVIGVAVMLPGLCCLH